MPIKKRTPTALKAEAVRTLAHVHKDFEMLITGDWVPDEDSCRAAQDGIERAIALLKEAGALPPSTDLAAVVARI